jgi:hypothetical protein
MVGDRTLGYREKTKKKTIDSQPGEYNMTNQPGEHNMEFQQRLQQKQREAATRALLDAIVEDPCQSISSVVETLEADTEASYFSEVFNDLSLGRLFLAMLTGLVEGRVSMDAMRRSLGEDADTLTDKLLGLKSALQHRIENDDDDGDQITIDHALSTAPFGSPVPTPPSKPKKNKAKGKGKGKKKAKVEAAAAEEPKKTKKKKAPPKAGDAEDQTELDLSDSKVHNTFRKSIVSYLKAGDCLDFESGAPAQKIREAVGGSPKQVRDELASLIEEEQIGYDGKARGTKYFLIA